MQNIDAGALVGLVRRKGRGGYKYGFKLLYEKTVFRVPVKVRKNLKRRSAAVKVLIFIYVR